MKAAGASEVRSNQAKRRTSKGAGSPARRVVRREPGGRVGVAAKALLYELVAVHGQVEGSAGAHVVEGGVVPVDDADHDSHRVGGDQPRVLGVPYPPGVRGRDL